MGGSPPEGANGKNSLGRPQQTRVNNFKAKHVAHFFLENRAQPAHIQAAYDSAQTQDDMADALLQALASANVGVQYEGIYQPEIIDLLDC